MVQQIQDIHPQLIRDEVRTDNIGEERRILVYEIVELASVASKEVESLQYALVFGVWSSVKHSLDILASGDIGPFEGTSPESHALITEVARKLAKKYDVIEGIFHNGTVM